MVSVAIQVYENELERIFRARTTADRNCNTPIRIQRRYVAMLAAHPRRPFHWMENDRWEKIRRMSVLPDVSIQEKYELDKMKDTMGETWDQEMWHRGKFPNGIPTLGSELFDYTCLNGASGLVARKFERMFHAKLMEWVASHERQSFRSQVFFCR